MTTLVPIPTGMATARPSTDSATTSAPPIIAAVDDSAASRAAVDEAVNLAAELEVPLVFVYVRRGPAGIFGGPVYKRRLTKQMRRARQVIDRALQIAKVAGVAAEAEILEGSPSQRIVEFGRDRGAQLVVVGSRRRRLGRSVSPTPSRDPASDLSSSRLAVPPA